MITTGKKFLQAAIHSLQDLLLPTCCAHCKNIVPMHSILCNDCFCKIKPVVSVPMQITKKYSMSVLTISAYKDPLRSLILAKKWSDRIAARNLGELMWQLTNVAQIDADYIVPVPLHWTRYARRGYNQTEEIATVLATKKRIPIVHALKRVKKTAFQTTLSSDDRQKNLQNAFVLQPEMKEQLRGKRILVVDDLLTTGATLHAAARMLVTARPAVITAVVPCRVV